MNTFDMFTFDYSPREQSLEELKPGDAVTAGHFLTMMEGEEEAAWEDAFRILAERGVLLDLSDLPKTTFPVRLNELCQKYGKTFSRVQTESGLSKSLFYALVNGTRTPKKHHILRIGFALELCLEELNELLKLAHLKELYAKRKEDAIILFGLKNHLAPDDIEELLTEAGSDLHLLEK